MGWGNQGITRITEIRSEGKGNPRVLVRDMGNRGSQLEEWGRSQGWSSPGSCLQVTVGSGRPTARQSRFTLAPSFTVTGEEMFTMRAGTAGQGVGRSARGLRGLPGSRSPGPGPPSSPDPGV